MSEIVAFRYRYKDALTWVHSTTEPARHPNLIVEPLCVASFTPSPRGGSENDWYEEWLKLRRKFKSLKAAALEVVEETAKIHDNEPWPVKYRAPYGAIVKLTKELADA